MSTFSPVHTATGMITGVVDVVLAPAEWGISHILVTAHAAVSAAGLPPGSGWAWVASVALLVVVVRGALLPLAIAQVRSARRAADASGDHQAVPRPTGCLPLLVQVPVLMALFRVLDGVAQGHPIAAMTPRVITQVDSATVWGVSLSQTLSAGGSATALAAGLTMAIAAAAWLLQHRQVHHNTPVSALAGPSGTSLRWGVWIVPVITAASGLTFPIGVLVYWACTNTWSLAQQAAVIHWLPTPGSPAHVRVQRDPR